MNRRAFSQIWAIAWHSITHAIRMKVALVLIAFLLVLVPALPVFFLKPDGTHIGQIKLCITYCVYLTAFLLSVLTIFLSTMTLNVEIKDRQIFLLDTKPVPRGIVLVGKWVGVMLINAVLLFAMFAVSYGLARYFARKAPNETDRQYAIIKTKILTARHVVTPDLPDFTKEDIDEQVDRVFLEWQRADAVPVGLSENKARDRIREMLLKSGAWQIPPYGEFKWVVRGMPTFDDWLIVRFKLLASANKSSYQLPGRFVINESGEPKVPIEGEFQVKKRHSFGVSPSVVKKDGSVEIRFFNLDRDYTAIFPFDGGLELLYPAGTLAQNFARVGLNIIFKLAFLAIVGIAASTFLSFPVAILATLTVFIAGQLGDFLFTEVFNSIVLFGPEPNRALDPVHTGDKILQIVLQSFFSIFPDFRSYDVVPKLADGRMITWLDIVRCWFWVPFVRGGIAGLVGWLIYRRRELAGLRGTA